MFGSRTRAASGVAALALLAALTLAACQNPASGVATLGDSSSPSASPSAEASPGDLTQFTKCMSDHGIEIEAADAPDSGQGGSGMVSSGGFGFHVPSKYGKDEVDAALEACKAFMPSGGDVPHNPTPEELAQMRRFSQCMRENGLPDFPDPGADGGISIHNDGSAGSLDPNSEVFKAAQQKCEQYRPTPPSGAPTVHENGSGS